MYTVTSRVKRLGYLGFTFLSNTNDLVTAIIVDNTNSGSMLNHPIYAIKLIMSTLVLVTNCG